MPSKKTSGESVEIPIEIVLRKTLISSVVAVFDRETLKRCVSVNPKLIENPDGGIDEITSMVIDAKKIGLHQVVLMAIQKNPGILTCEWYQDGDIEIDAVGLVDFDRVEPGKRLVVDARKHSVRTVQVEPSDVTMETLKKIASAKRR